MRTQDLPRGSFTRPETRAQKPATRRSPSVVVRSTRGAGQSLAQVADGTPRARVSQGHANAKVTDTSSSPDLTPSLNTFNPPLGSPFAGVSRSEAGQTAGRRAEPRKDGHGHPHLFPALPATQAPPGATPARPLPTARPPRPRPRTSPRGGPGNGGVSLPGSPLWRVLQVGDGRGEEYANTSSQGEVQVAETTLAMLPEGSLLSRPQDPGGHSHRFSCANQEPVCLRKPQPKKTRGQTLQSQGSLPVCCRVATKHTSLAQA
ncbi:translation initiation factor IF-2-like [Talpa occidentalis]|uniref:translation initiation factor IF-2-like n=1 Tax=Talpa occidentalis TaxID=50954 RepID=UPI00188E0513|nr:translation initiation factor IF-2-like [Talpa occidentalis]